MSKDGRARPSVLRSAYRRVSVRRERTLRRGGVDPASVRDTVHDVGRTEPALIFAGHLRRLTVGCARLAAGYAVTAKRARDAHVADVAASLATLHRAVAGEIAARLASVGETAPRTKSTCGERLRWEWLASTGGLIDGGPEQRVLAECARIETDAYEAVAALQRDAAVQVDPQLRQLLALLQRARAASVRLEPGHAPPRSRFAVA